MRTRVKICGITEPGEALNVARAGADAIGLVFYPSSRRVVDATLAKAIVAALPPFVTVVGLFVDAAPATIRSVLDTVSLDLLQFHGDETPEMCRQFGRPYLKAVRMRPGVTLAAVAERYADATGLLVDTYRPGSPGGTGETFDWKLLPRSLPLPLILAGGLTPENVGDAVRAVRPWAVDVSGGVEAASGGKSPDRVAAFMRGTRDADRD